MAILLSEDSINSPKEQETGAALEKERRLWRTLCQFSPVIGATWIGFPTAVIDWLLPPIGTHRGTWAADYTYWLALAISIALGAFAGAVAGEAGDLELQGRWDEAAETCLRWGIAGSVLLLLGPMANFDYAIRHIAAQYVGLIRSFFPLIVATLAILWRGIILARDREA